MSGAAMAVRRRTARVALPRRLAPKRAARRAVPALAAGSGVSFQPVEVRKVVAHDAVFAGAQLDEGNAEMPQPPGRHMLVHRHGNWLGTQRNRRGTVGRCRHRSLSPRIVVGQDYSAIGKVNGVAPPRSGQSLARTRQAFSAVLFAAGIDIVARRKKGPVPALNRENAPASSLHARRQFVKSWPGHCEGQSYLLHSIGFDA